MTMYNSHLHWCSYYIYKYNCILLAFNSQGRGNDFFIGRAGFPSAFPPSPLSLPFPPLPPLPTPPLEVGPLNPARESGGAQ